jgi:hypothetical protein
MSEMRTMVVELSCKTPSLSRAREIFARQGCPSCGWRQPFPLSIRYDSARMAVTALHRINSILQDWRESSSNCGWCERRERILRLEAW